MVSRDVEILTLGNELLIGRIANTNAQWLAQNITELGLAVTRVVTVGDSVDIISSTVKESIQRRPAFIITVGGLGPTFDDQTLSGIARALKKPLKLHPKALRYVRQHYRKIKHRSAHEISEYQRKMAMLPAGSVPIRNPVGTAPAVVSAHGLSRIISLPGVPDEMKGIFESYLKRILRAQSTGLRFAECEMHVSGIFESELAPVIAEVMRRNPSVYIKSHALGGESARKLPIRLHFSTFQQQRVVSRRLIARSVLLMSRMLPSLRGFEWRRSSGDGMGVHKIDSKHT